MASLTCRTWDKITGSNVFSRGSDAVLSSCGRLSRMVAMFLRATRNNDRPLKNTSCLCLMQPGIIFTYWTIYGEGSVDEQRTGVAEKFRPILHARCPGSAMCAIPMRPLISSGRHRLAVFLQNGEFKQLRDNSVLNTYLLFHDNVSLSLWM